MKTEQMNKADHQTRAPRWLGVALRRMARLFRGQQSIFLTHTAGPWCAPGTRYERDGNNYEITEVRRVAPTALYAGGTAACWEVFGRPTKEPSDQDMPLRTAQWSFQPEPKKETK